MIIIVSFFFLFFFFSFLLVGAVVEKRTGVGIVIFDGILETRNPSSNPPQAL